MFSHYFDILGPNSISSLLNTMDVTILNVAGFVHPEAELGEGGEVVDTFENGLCAGGCLVCVQDLCK